MSHDITKLPKWAQNRIETAEKDIEYWRTKVFGMQEGDTNVFQQDYSGDPPYRKALARDTRIIFVTDNAEFEVGFRSNDQLHVTSQARLVISPISSNLIEIRRVE